MSLTRDESCGCPPLAHPPSPDIPAGLPTLGERQLSSFPEYRAAMLSAIPNYLEFTDWRARSEADLGVMLLEAWSVVLDTTAFYDARIAERSYLQTAPDQAAARNLTALIGHRPRPAIAARVDLAVQADGADPVTLPKITAFRSGPFDGEAPQVFELVTSHQIWPQRNRWKLAPVRDAAFDGTLRFLPRRAPSAGAMLVIWSATQATAARVLSVDPDPAPDGVTYQKAILETEINPGLSAMIGVPRTSLSIAILRQSMPEYEAPYDPTTGVIVVRGIIETGIIDLDSVYPQLRPGHRAIAEIGDDLYPVEIVSVSRILKSIPDTGSPPAKQAVTRVCFTPQLTLGVGTFTLHGNPFLLGEPGRIARTQIQLADLQNSGSLESPVELGNAPGGGSVIARGEGAEGARLGGTVIEDGDGQAHFAPDAGSTDFGILTTPVKLFGNVVEAVRGETVTDEELGSGNAAEPHQSFTLKKKPLTWV